MSDAFLANEFCGGSMSLRLIELDEELPFSELFDVEASSKLFNSLILDVAGCTRIQSMTFFLCCLLLVTMFSVNKGKHNFKFYFRINFST